MPTCQQRQKARRSSALVSLNGEANGDVDTLATVIICIVYHGRSQYYMSFMVAMMIYHMSCPAGPWYDKSHSTSVYTVSLILL